MLHLPFQKNLRSHLPKSAQNAPAETVASTKPLLHLVAVPEIDHVRDSLPFLLAQKPTLKGLNNKAAKVDCRQSTFRSST